MTARSRSKQKQRDLLILIESNPTENIRKKKQDKFNITRAQNETIRSSETKITEGKRGRASADNRSLNKHFRSEKANSGETGETN